MASAKVVVPFVYIKMNNTISHIRDIIMYPELFFLNEMKVNEKDDFMTSGTRIKITD
jgi:hypothetical protein